MTEILAKPISIEALHSRIVNIIKELRPFIKAKHYFSPRRREDDADAGGMAGESVVSQRTDLRAWAQNSVSEASDGGSKSG